MYLRNNQTNLVSKFAKKGSEGLPLGKLSSSVARFAKTFATPGEARTEFTERFLFKMVTKDKKQFEKAMQLLMLLAAEMERANIAQRVREAKIRQIYQIQKRNKKSE